MRRLGINKKIKGDKMLKTLDTSYNGTLKFIEETLSDGSKVYNVGVGTVSINCSDEFEALQLFDRLSNFTIIDNQ